MRLLTRRALFGLIAVISLNLRPAHAAELDPGRPAASEIWSRTELYFGTSKPDGTVVTDPEFAQFIDRAVTPRFPDGLTLLTGYGQFKNSAGTIIRERSQVLILFYPVHTRDANKKIQEIRELYKAAFRQESVLRVDTFSLVSF
jgi:hypothetical protein